MSEVFLELLGERASYATGPVHFLVLGYTVTVLDLRAWKTIFTLIVEA